MKIFVELHNIYNFLIKWIISICLSCNNKIPEIDCSPTTNNNVDNHSTKSSNNKLDLSINHIELLKKHLRDKMENIKQKISDYNFEKNIPNKEPTNPYIMKFDNILSLKECNQIIELFKNDKFQNVKMGHTGGGLNLGTKFLNEICLLEHTNNIQIIRARNIIKKKLVDVINMYASECEKKNNNPFIKNILMDRGMDLSFNIIRCKKYTKNKSYYRWHIDGGMSNNGDSFLTIIFYLNDLGNEGGTCFIDGIMHGKAGRAVVFPALWYMNHRSLCCENTDKYIINIIINKKNKIYKNNK